MQCVNVYNGKKYRMVDCRDNDISHNVVIPSQFARLLVKYQEHAEAKSLAPDGGSCKADTVGLLRRVHVVARELRYIGKEADRKWEQGDDLSVLESKIREYGRATMVVPGPSLAKAIRQIGIRKTMALTKMSQPTIEKIVRRENVRRATYDNVVKIVTAYKSKKSKAEDEIGTTAKALDLPWCYETFVSAFRGLRHRAQAQN